jgi:triosephosphate isomerase
MRKYIIAGNWKMNKTGAETIQLVNALAPRVANLNRVDVVICPPFTVLSQASAAIKNSNIGLGAQNMYWEDSGAFTGEISAAMLKNAGCQYVIIGHSERRQFFGETNQTVNKKTQKALSAGLLPIVCVGELLEERQSGITEKVINSQMVEGLAGISSEDMKKVIIAYEPVWAIGTGVTATPEQAEAVHAFIRGLIEKLYNKNIAAGLRIQYGGSMKAENTEELLNQPDIDGGLIGGAALKADSFLGIIEIANKLSA